MRLDCDDLKRGLISRANGYAERLLKHIADEYRAENERFGFLYFRCHFVKNEILHHYLQFLMISLRLKNTKSSSKTLTF